MKKALILFCLLIGSLSAHAQFEQGKKYVSTSLSGIGCSYSAKEDFRFGLDASVGYFAADCLMLRATVGYDHTHEIDDFNIGLGARYYFDQCGVYVGGGLEYAHFTKNNNDLLIPIEVGYAFFITKYITLQPAVYYKMSTNDFGGGSTVGLKIGAGFYF